MAPCVQANESTALQWYTLMQLAQNLHTALTSALRKLDCQPSSKHPAHQVQLRPAHMLTTNALYPS